MPQTSASVFKTINAGPLTPEKLFQRLGLPITTIEGVTTKGAGRSRKYHLKGKTHFCPELLAKAHYEAMGNLVNWSEGLALRIALTALERAICLPLWSHFSLTGAPPDVMAVAVKREDDLLKMRVERYREVNSAAATMSDEEVQTLVRAEPQRTRGPLESLNAKLAAEASDFLRKDPPLLGFASLLAGDVESISQQLGRFASISCVRSAEVLIQAFNASLQAAMNNPDSIHRHLSMPEVTPDKTDPSNFFKTDWTMAFAQTILKECSLKQLIDLQVKYGPITPRWDLTLIDAATKELRFVEVKCLDDFTEFQIRRLPDEVAKGTALELCVVKTVV